MIEPDQGCLWGYCYCLDVVGKRLIIQVQNSTTLAPCWCGLEYADCVLNRGGYHTKKRADLTMTLFDREFTVQGALGSVDYSILAILPVEL